ncbi:MAG TPA: hypothetical protein VIY29_26285, partial [Ktedonobacteraceae bacterium]
SLRLAALLPREAATRTGSRERGGRRRETLCTVGGRNDSGTAWATPLEQGWVETCHKWLPFSAHPQNK